MSKIDLSNFKDTQKLPDYFMVSPNGEIYSKRSGRLMKQNKIGNGYLGIQTKIGGRKGETYCLRVHREVALAFIPNPENKPQVNHIDGDKTNNKVENLEWVTYSENSIHAVETGLFVSLVGEENGGSKLNEIDVLFIRENFIPKSRTYGARALGRKFGVNKTTIMKIIRRELWKHI